MVPALVAVAGLLISLGLTLHVLVEEPILHVSYGDGLCVSVGLSGAIGLHHMLLERRARVRLQDE